MAGEPLGISANIAIAVAKYGGEWSQEDIDSGRAIPYEVVHTDISELTEAEIKALGLDHFKEV